MWVYLVVRSLVRGLTNDDDLNTLHRRLDSYPDTLDGYFQRMYDRIESVYRKQSARLLIAALSAERTLPFWAPRCIELEADDPDYALSIAIPPTVRDARHVYGCNCAEQLEPADSATGHGCYFYHGEDQRFTSRSREKLGRYLDAKCADLLEVCPDGITCVHRTARDFLAQGDLSVKLYAHGGVDYDVGLSLARLSLADTKRGFHSGVLHPVHRSTQTARTEVLSYVFKEWGEQTKTVHRLATFEKLVNQRNIGAYAALFDDLEAKWVDGRANIMIQRPSTVWHFRARAVGVEYEYEPYSAVAVLDVDKEDLQMLFAGREQTPPLEEVAFASESTPHRRDFQPLRS